MFYSIQSPEMQQKQHHNTLLLTLSSKYHPEFINRTPNEPRSSEMIDRKAKTNRHYQVAKEGKSMDVLLRAILS